MKRTFRVLFSLFFVVFLVTPVFALQTGEEMVPPDEEIVPVAPEETAASVEEGQVSEPSEEVTLSEESDEGVITGRIVSVDTNAGTVTVLMIDGTKRMFYVIDEETILWKGIEDIELKDVKEGDEAEVGYYTDESGKLISSWIDVLIEEETVSPKEEVASEEELVPVEE